MKSSFGRSFTTVATVLLLSLLMLGTSFQILVKEYLEENAVSSLQQDAHIIADLAAAYSVDEGRRSRDFLLNLDVASKVSGFDAVVCDASGEIVICSCSPMVCDHLGWHIDEGYRHRHHQGTLHRFPVCCLCPHPRQQSHRWHRHRLHPHR